MSVNVIKVHARTGHSPPRVVKRATREASLQAEDILAGARSKAAAIIANAECERETIVEESRTQGYNAGLDKWNETLAGAWKAREEYLAQNETHLVKLAAAMARKIVGDCMNAEPSALLHTAREAIRALRSERKIRLHVRAADEVVIREHIRDLQAASMEGGEILVMIDNTIIAGGCIVESDIGMIDAQFDTQLASMERALLRGLQSNEE